MATGTAGNNFKKLAVILVFSFIATESHGFRTWTCNNGKCVKGHEDAFEHSVSINECKVTCLDYAGLWPKPTGYVNTSTSTVQFDPTSIAFRTNDLPPETQSLIHAAGEIFLDRIRRKLGDPIKRYGDNIFRLEIGLELYDPNVTHFQTSTDERYRLQMGTNAAENKVTAFIQSYTFFGIRHGLETLSQLIVFDDLHNIFKIIRSAQIEDMPVYTHRGIALDTARSYISIGKIKNMLDLMAMNKLNTFHWHMTDSQSFPFVSVTYPQLSAEGAYSATEVYTHDDIRHLVRYAQERGIRIVPEFDAPAHVGEGWAAIDQDLVTCFKWEPWRDYCVEPPCGQFDPTNELLYEVLGNIFREYVELFPSDLFHMGGDEVSTFCWQSTYRIVQWMRNNNYTIDNHGFHNLWIYYQYRAYEKLKATGSDPKPILWTSTLTSLQNLEQYISPEVYIIQIWTKKDDKSIKNLLEKGYQLIFSNYDELYLDCGGPSWVGEPGQNWCSPYINWQHVYEHSPTKIARSLGVTKDSLLQQILGSEAAIWTEQIDDSTVLSRSWPRAAALAERLWADPTEGWKQAKYRMNHHRNRLSENGAQASLYQPKWCLHNDGHCE